MKQKFRLLMFVFAFLVVFVSSYSTYGYDGINYWIEHDENGNPQDNVWVKVNLTANEPLGFYVYYGSSTAPSYSDGDSVFEFFDDFDGSSLDMGKWTIQTYASYEIIDSKLHIKPVSSSGSNQHHTLANIGFYKDVIVEVLYHQFNPTSGGEVLFYSDLGPTTTWAENQLVWSEQSEEGLFHWYDIQYHDLATGDVSKWYIMKYILHKDTGKYRWYIYENDRNLFTYEDSANMRDNTGTYIKYFSMCSKTDGEEYGADWVFVRKYSSTEPSVLYGSEESGSWTIEGHTYTKRKKVTITSSEDLQDYQVALDYSQFGDDKLYLTTETPSLEVGLNQNLNYDLFRVNYNVTHSCYYNNLSANVTSVNLTLQAINLNDSTTLYNVTFEDVAENEIVSHTYTIQQSDAHDTIEFKCLIVTNVGSDEVNMSKVVENTPPTAPDLALLNSTIHVGEVLYAKAENSTDVDGDSLTYEYMFKNLNDNVVVQNWSATDHYTIQVSDAHDTIVVYARAYDGYNYSITTTTTIDVSNTNPTIDAWYVSPNETVLGNQVCIQVNASDKDNDTLHYYFKGLILTPWFYFDDSSKSWVAFSQSYTHATPLVTCDDRVVALDSSNSTFMCGNIVSEVSNIDNNTWCFSIPKTHAFLANAYVDWWAYFYVTVKDDYDEEDSKRSFKYPYEYWNESAPKVWSQEGNTSYVWGFNYTFVFYDEYTKNKWDFSIENATLRFYSSYGITKEWELNPSTTSNSQFVIKDRMSLYPYTGVKFVFEPQNICVNRKGFREIRPQIGYAKFDGEVKVWDIMTQWCNYILSPKVVFSDSSKPNCVIIIKFIDNKEETITDYWRPEGDAQDYYVPLILNNVYRIYACGSESHITKDYGYVSVVSDPLVLAPPSTQSEVLLQPQELYISYEPKVLPTNQSINLTVNVYDLGNNYKYYDLYLFEPNGSVLANVSASTTEFTKVLQAHTNFYPYGSRLLLKVYLFDESPVYNQEGLPSNAKRVVEFKIPVSYSYSYPLTSTLTRAMDSLGESLGIPLAKLLGFLIYVATIIIMTIIVSRIGVPGWIYLLGILGITYLFVTTNVIGASVGIIVGAIVIIVLILSMGTW